MYESFFGFKVKPFNITPDPTFLYLSDKHKEALAQLICGVKERRGFVVLSGEVGTGKTTLVRALLEEVDEDCEVAYIFNPKLSVTSFFRFVCQDFGLQAKGRSKVDYLTKLHDFLIETHNAGKTATLIIDEAQNLDDSLFEEVRMLTNLETSTQKLLQVFLVGQPELNDLLEQNELRQLKQRISSRSHLAPLDEKETKEYIHTRMRIAGAKNPDRFSDDAIRKIYKYSLGVPRLINNICDNSLLVGYAMEKPVIDAQIVQESAADLKLDQVPAGDRTKGQNLGYILIDRISSAPLVTILVLILIVLVAGGVGYFLVSGHPLSKPFQGIRSFLQSGQEIEGVDPVPAREEAVDEKGEGIRPSLQMETEQQGESLLPRPEPMREREPDRAEELTRAEISFKNQGGVGTTEIRIATAREGDTLGTIILREFGRVNEQLLMAIQELNPEIEDLDRIVVGQKIRLPLVPEDSTTEMR